MIKRIGKECFRYKISGIAMIACLALSMLAAYYGVTIYKNIYMEAREKQQYEYVYTSYFRCHANQLSDIPTLPQNVDCNLKILDCWMYSDAANATYLVNISIHSAEENVPLVSGRYADRQEEKRGEPILVLGQDRLEYAYTKGKDQYFDLYGDAYRVVGVLGSKRTKLYDTTVMLYWECLGEHTMQRLLTDNAEEFYLVLESNTVDTDQVYDTYIRNHYPVVSDSYESYSNGTAATPFHEKSFCIIIYLFCFVCISIVIRFWLEQRKHEMQICRAFGFSNRKILLRLLYSFGMMLVISLALFLLCCVGLNLILGNIVAEYQLGFSKDIILPYTGIFILSIFLAGVRPVCQFLHNSVIENLQ